MATYFISASYISIYFSIHFSFSSPMMNVLSTIFIIIKVTRRPVFTETVPVCFFQSYSPAYRKTSAAKKQPNSTNVGKRYLKDV